MKLLAAVAILLALDSLSLAAEKQPPAAFKSAMFVYVQAEDGDATRSKLSPADRMAISDVQDGLRDWNRYTLTTSEADADLIFVVRKGRLDSLPGSGGVPFGSPLPRVPIGRPGSNPQDPGTGMGEQEDTLRVYMRSAEGRRGNLIWKSQAPDGLEGPDVPLLLQLRKAVEIAYPDPPPDPKQKP